MVSMNLTATVQEGGRSDTLLPARETRNTTESRLLKLSKSSEEANRRDLPRLFSKRLLPQCGATSLLPQATRARFETASWDDVAQPSVCNRINTSSRQLQMRRSTCFTSFKHSVD